MAPLQPERERGVPVGAAQAQSHFSVRPREALPSGLAGNCRTGASGRWAQWAPVCHAHAGARLRGTLPLLEEAFPWTQGARGPPLQLDVVTRGLYFQRSVRLADESIWRGTDRLQPLSKRLVVQGTPRSRPPHRLQRELGKAIPDPGSEDRKRGPRRQELRQKQRPLQGPPAEREDPVTLPPRPPPCAPSSGRWGWSRAARSIRLGVHRTEGGVH